MIARLPGEGLIIYRQEDTGTIHPLVGNGINPDWSPDGSQIVFESDRDGNSEIYVMTADGSNPTNLTQNPAEDMDPAWQPEVSGG